MHGNMELKSFEYTILYKYLKLVMYNMPSSVPYNMKSSLYYFGRCLVDIL